jgi:hypothetical protein
MDCIDIYDHDYDTYNFALEIHKIQFEEIQYHEMKCAVKEMRMLGR